VNPPQIAIINPPEGPHLDQYRLTDEEIAAMGGVIDFGDTGLPDFMLPSASGQG
jgi:hypothetical protein